MSDLLNSASLVMIPSGYKEDVVYSQIPTDGSGDLVFTRASNGTRVNSAGLVEVCPWNLIQYSEDFTNGVWVGAGATQPTITANTTTAPNGTLTADTIAFASSNTSRLYQSYSGTSATYTLSLYAKSSSAKKFRFKYFDGTSDIFSSDFTTTSEWQRFTYTFDSQIVNFSIDNESVGGAGSMFIWGAQLNIGSTAKPYFPTTDRLNVPRLTYQNGGGGCPSLLLEKQSTNLVNYSQDFGNAYWSKGGATITANATTSPDGTQDADKIAENTTSTTTHYINKGFTLSATGYTSSVFAKASERKWIFLIATTSADVGAFFDLENGVIGTVSSGFTASIENFGNGWYRCSISFTATAATWYINYLTATANNTYNYAGTIGNGLYIWGAQLEASSYATSYIPTTSSSATRVADACYKTGISSLFGTNQGTFFLDFVNIGKRESSSSYPYIFDIVNASLNRIIMYASATNTGYDTFDLWDSTNFVLGNVNLYHNTRYKLAVKYSSSGIVCYINGSLAINSTTSFNPQMSAFYLARRYSDTEINSLIVNQNLLFPTALTNAELASLTTI